jgi:hypothetical protein
MGEACRAMYPSLYEKKDVAIDDRVISTLVHDRDVAFELAQGNDGYSKHKSLLMKIDYWSSAFLEGVCRERGEEGPRADR